MSELTQSTRATIGMSARPEQAASSTRAQVESDPTSPARGISALAIIPSVVIPASGVTEASSEGSPATDARAAPAPSLATLLTQARLAQAQLAAQPLPIANHSGDFILKLLGG